MLWLSEIRNYDESKKNITDRLSLFIYFWRDKIVMKSIKNDEVVCDVSTIQNHHYIQFAHSACLRVLPRA